mmetsp:Transcript_8033/g.24745  ORF Transcript_8033/g.24745 Transcript_8033/m.24745 type:complete len:224 (-) Transcript_8033:895-1566(-)
MDGRHVHGRGDVFLHRRDHVFRPGSSCRQGELLRAKLLRRDVEEGRRRRRRRVLRARGQRARRPLQEPVQAPPPRRQPRDAVPHRHGAERRLALRVRVASPIEATDREEKCETESGRGRLVPAVLQERRRRPGREDRQESRRLGHREDIERRAERHGRGRARGSRGPLQTPRRAEHRRRHQTTSRRARARRGLGRLEQARGAAERPRERLARFGFSRRGQTAL